MSVTTKGTSLIEIVIAIGVFLLFALGIYAGIEFVFKIVYQSRLRILETAILNEEVEIVRNMPFEDIGIINGSPVGLLPRLSTTTRNGIDFTLTRTIRNIDDPYDGTIGGVPNDTSPADYKLVDIEIVCTACGQRAPLSVTTFAAPRYLEGDPDHGALFIEVFDANATPLVGATVQVISTSTETPINLTDTTDNSGMLRLVDLGEGLEAYHIIVSHPGFTIDKTVTTSATILNPIKPPASVIAQDVSEISFSIDHVSSLAVETITNLCVPFPTVDVSILGTKRIGVDPDVFLVDENITTDALGTYTLSNLVWDSYGMRLSDFDLIGSIPALPINLPPGVEQPVQLLLGLNTAHSLLVNVQDSITEQPVSQAQVQVTASGYDQSKTTGVGFIRQTDWSGGTGQELFVNQNQYWSDNTAIDATTVPGNITLRDVGGLYQRPGILESSTFDLGTIVNFISLAWEPFAQPPQTGVDSLTFQIATSNTSSPAAWSFRGPDGTTSTYYNTTNVSLHESHGGTRYLRYRAYFDTQSVTSTPTLSDLSISYTTSCTPPGQAYFGSLQNQEYTVEVSRSGYQTSTESITVDGDIIFAVDLVAQ